MGKDFYRRFALYEHFSHVSQHLIFQGSFWFMAKTTGRHRDFPNTPCRHACIAFPSVNIPHQKGTFVTSDEPLMTDHYHLKSIVYLRVHWVLKILWVWTYV